LYQLFNAVIFFKSLAKNNTCLLLLQVAEGWLDENENSKFQIPDSKFLIFNID